MVVVAASWAAASRAPARTASLAVQTAYCVGISATTRSRTASMRASTRPPGPPTRIPRVTRSASARMTRVSRRAHPGDVARQTTRPARCQHPSGPLRRHARDQDGTDTEGSQNEIPPYPPLLPTLSRLFSTHSSVIGTGFICGCVLARCPSSDLLHLPLWHGRAANPRHAVLMRCSVAIGTGAPHRRAATSSEAIAAQGAASDGRQVRAGY
jgi:hypothetical protein